MTAPPPLPRGFALTLDRATRLSRDGSVLYGGAPWRVLRLTSRGAVTMRGLCAGDRVTDAPTGALARRLVDAGLAHPRPPGDAGVTDIDVVVPAHDRPDLLGTCLSALAGLPVVVVDDGSTDADAVARTVAAHPDARLVRREDNGGPAAARRSGAAATTAATVAFVDSDCLVTAATLRMLAGHLADPCVGAVAPRIRPAVADTLPRAVRAFAAVQSPLDMGDRPALARPGTPLRYVPSTVLVVRRAALDEVDGFDDDLRVGEDVDLCWRLADAGWSVRYEPGVTANHFEPSSTGRWLRRRYRYGASAGPLASRHGRRLAGPALRGMLAPVVVGRRIRRTGLPVAPVLLAATAGAGRTVVGLARWAVPLWWPVLLLAARHRPARLAAAVVVAGPHVADWRERRPAIGPARYLAVALADGAAYGAGVWVGSVRARTWRPLFPALAPARVRRSAGDGRARPHDDPRLE